MTSNANAKKSFIGDFKALSIKQIAGIVIALVAAIVLEVMGFGTLSCFGFFIIAVILYMVPHLLGVLSVRVKATVGILFIVIAMIVGSFAYGGIVDQTTKLIDDDTDTIKDVSYDAATDTITMTLDPVDGLTNWNGVVKYGEITSSTFGTIIMPSTVLESEISYTETAGAFPGTANLPLEDGKFYYVSVQILKEDGSMSSALTFTVDTGISGGGIVKINAYGAAVTVASASIIFFMILIFSALMRRSAEKTRAKMEADGRLYPQGYGRCKECGGMVLPGEVTCRKCGAYIDVPDELKAHKKDYFTCGECGAEVPNDADVCPKCGATFDTVVNEVQHEDGSVDESQDTFECSECGAIVPSNASRCPKCGAKFDEEE